MLVWHHEPGKNITAAGTPVRLLLHGKKEARKEETGNEV